VWCYEEGVVWCVRVVLVEVVELVLGLRSEVGWDGYCFELVLGGVDEGCFELFGG